MRKFSNCKSIETLSAKVSLKQMLWTSLFIFLLVLKYYVNLFLFTDSPASEVDFSRRITSYTHWLCEFYYTC